MVPLNLWSAKGLLLLESLAVSWRVGFVGLSSQTPAAICGPHSHSRSCNLWHLDNVIYLLAGKIWPLEKKVLSLALSEAMVPLEP